MSETILVSELKPDPEPYPNAVTSAKFQTLARAIAGDDDDWCYRLYRFCVKAGSHARRKIGSPITVRLEKNVRVSGVVVEADVYKLRNRGRSTVAQFRVVIESGEAKARRELFIEGL